MLCNHTEKARQVHRETVDVSFRAVTIIFRKFLTILSLQKIYNLLLLFARSPGFIATSAFV